jgi:RNA polymerase sigma factor (sigma-70 family)
MDNLEKYKKLKNEVLETLNKNFNIYKPIYLFLKNIRKYSIQTLNDYLILYKDYRRTGDSKLLDEYIKINSPINGIIFHHILKYYSKDIYINLCSLELKCLERLIFTEFKKYIYYTFAHKYTLNRKYYNDALYEAYFKLINCLYKYDDTKGKFGTYLCNSLKGIRYIYYRKYKNENKDLSLYDRYNDNSMIIDNIYDTATQEHTEKIIENDIKEKINKCIKYLLPIEKEIIEMRYGFYNGSTLTYREIAKYLGFSYTKVRYIEKEAKKKLKKYMKGGENEVQIR